jgi:hypothetical protein
MIILCVAGTEENTEDGDESEAKPKLGREMHEGRDFFDDCLDAEDIGQGGRNGKCRMGDKLV